MLQILIRTSSDYRVEIPYIYIWQRKNFNFSSVNWKSGLKQVRIKEVRLYTYTKQIGIDLKDPNFNFAQIDIITLTNYACIIISYLFSDITIYNFMY